MPALEWVDVTSGLRFPEGPVAMADGSVVLVEMFGGRIARVLPDGAVETVAEIEGGPNGLAVGPDAALYLCNNGGCFTPVDLGDWLLPGPFDPEHYIGGRIQRVDVATGDVTDLYTECDGRPLRAPNDIVFDDDGGMWITDHGIRDGAARTSDLTSIYYARTDGSSIIEVVHPIEAPNGIGLSPDGTRVYWAETFTGRVMQRVITGVGEVEHPSPLDPSVCLHGLVGLQLLDSLAVDGEGNVCVGTLVNGGITVISPDGARVEHFPTGDPLTTNICFGDDDGSGEFRTAYATLSGSGRLAKCRWPYRGLRLHTQ
ncbi:MAG: SMP-30/gluconolactonase/LRE family protein [Ilumatobacteraceae bacterium]